MKNKKTTKLSLLTVFILVTLISCGKKEVLEYEYGVVYTSVSTNQSRIDTYNKNNEYLETHKIGVGGLTFGAFMRNHIDQEDNIYYTSSTFVNTSRDFIVDIDKNNLTAKKINIKGSSPTVFAIDDEYA